jgi:hypothetical protein
MSCWHIASRSRTQLKEDIPGAELNASALCNVFRHPIEDLTTKWKQLETESDFLDYTIHEFDELMMEFVASYSSEQYRSDLLNRLRQPTKPKEQAVQVFFGRLLEMNDLVSFFPGMRNRYRTDRSRKPSTTACPDRGKKDSCPRATTPQK